MFTSRPSKLLYALLIIMIILVPLSAVLAIPPTTTVEEFHLVEEVLADCGDFLVFADTDYKVTTKEFFDNDGNLKEIRVYYSLTNGLVYNSEYPEMYLPEGPDHAMFRIDPGTGIIDESGLALHLNIPGHGIIAIDAGKAILNPDWSIIWERGPHMFFEQELNDLCSALTVD